MNSGAQLQLRVIKLIGDRYILANEETKEYLYPLTRRQLMRKIGELIGVA